MYRPDMGDGLVHRVDFQVQRSGGTWHVCVQVFDAGGAVLRHQHQELLPGDGVGLLLGDGSGLGITCLLMPMADPDRPQYQH